MRDIGAALRATSEARELCLSLKRAHLGQRVLESLRAGEAAALGGEELHVALGLALAAGEQELVQRALAGLPPERVSQDAVLLTFRDAARAGGS